MPQGCCWREMGDALGALSEHLEPDLARSVLEVRPQLAEAAKRFPLGMQSVQDEASEGAVCEDAMMIGSCFGWENDPPNARIIPIVEALANDFEAAFQEAFERYANDSDAVDPNEAPKECWPSTTEFRNILFKAARHRGLSAMKYLDRIPDPDLRLFAQIELCAAIAGLPQLGGLTIQYPRKRRIVSPAELDQTLGSVLPGIQCPKCKWPPRARNLWSCKCGHNWNTFDTRGLCPGCGYQWEITGCLHCGAVSPRLEW